MGRGLPVFLMNNPVFLNDIGQDGMMQQFLVLYRGKISLYIQPGAKI